MRKRRRGGYSYQKYSYQNSCERDRKRRKRKIAVISVMAVLILVLGAGGVTGVGLLRTKGLAESGVILTGGPAQAEGASAEQMADGASQADASTVKMADGPAQMGISAALMADMQGEESAGGDDRTEETEETWADTHLRVKGIYVTGPMAGSSGFQDLLTLVDETELNAMVIDVKNDEGQITYSMSLESARDMGVCVAYIGDIESLMAQLKEHGVYAIARIVCFKDPCLAQHRPELALMKPDQTPVVDANGLAWVNPYRTEVWEYLTDIALEAAQDGFDEIQFDYVRFPIGEEADQADYGVDMESYPKQQAITDFLDFATEKLDDRGIPVTADVFGTIIGSETDVERVGQDYTQLGKTVKALCPMVYPSHYGNGVFGLAVPDAQPYETVLEALTDSREELAAVPEEQRAVVRPWLQAFTATWVQGHISYDGEEIRSQIQAVYDAGYEEWFLWNAANRYTADGLLPEEEDSGQ